MRDIENVAFFLLSIKEWILNDEHAFNKEAINNFGKNKFQWFMVALIKQLKEIYIFTYYALKRELLDPKQEHDTMKSLEGLMHWESRESKEFVQFNLLYNMGSNYSNKGKQWKASRCLKKAFKIDNASTHAIERLVKDGDLESNPLTHETISKEVYSPAGHFDELFLKLQEKSKIIAEIPKNHSKSLSFYFLGKVPVFYKIIFLDDPISSFHPSEDRNIFYEILILTDLNYFSKFLEIKDES